MGVSVSGWQRRMASSTSPSPMASRLDLVGLLPGGDVLYAVFVLQLLQDDLGPLDHLLRQPASLATSMP